MNRCAAKKDFMIFKRIRRICVTLWIVDLVKSWCICGLYFSLINLNETWFSLSLHKEIGALDFSFCEFVCLEENALCWLLYVCAERKIKISKKNIFIWYKMKSRNAFRYVGVHMNLIKSTSVRQKIYFPRESPSIQFLSAFTTRMNLKKKCIHGK